MYLQSLKLLRPMVKEKMLYKNTLFDIDLGVKVTQNVAQYPRHHVTLVHQQSLILLHPTVKEKMHLQKNTLYKIRNVSQCPPHPVPLHLQSLKLLRQNFRRRSIYKKIQYLTLTLGSRSHKILASTIYIM